MKKQRILALLLACSLALGTDGATVLAAGPSVTGDYIAMENGGTAADEGAAGVQTPAGETAVDETDGTAGDGQQAPGQPGDTADDGQQNPEEPDHTAGDDRQDPEQPDDTAGDDQQTPEQPGDNQQTPEQPGDTAGDDQHDPEEPGDMTGDDRNDPENPGASEEEPNPDDKVTEDISANDVPADGKEDAEKPEEEEAPGKLQSLAPRMMSFQDEVGMRITYDANAQYDYTIDENGTLTGIRTAGGGEVEGNVVLDETKGIKRIAAGAFTGNTRITYIKMPAGVTAIGADAFKGCTDLKGMTVPTGVTAIEESAFEGCSALTQFALPATVESIGNRAFYGDSRLFMVYMKSISISRLQSIGDYAFYGCSTLIQFCSDTSFTFPESLTGIGEHAFQECRAIKSIVFSENISAMGDYAFASCNALTEVVLPRALTAIPRYGFSDCHFLTSVSFGGGTDNETRTIGAYAFQSCYKLGSMELLRVNKIERNAYLDCSSLIRVQIPNMDCDIEDDAFPDVETLYLIGMSPSTAQTYTKNRKIKFIALNSDEGYYKYKEPIDVTGSGKGKIVLLTDKITDSDKYEAYNPNKANGGKGVETNTVIYVSTQPEKGSKLVRGSLKYNGLKIEYNKTDGWYSFKMPAGGAVVSAEFEDTAGNTTITGTRCTYEFSNGADGNGGAELKIGQTTRLFLLDVDNNVIPTSKVKFSSDKPEIVKVADNGVVTALKEGLAHIDMRVTGVNGEIINIAPVHVSKTNVASLKLTADSYDRDVITITEQTVGEQKVQTASMGINAVNEHEEKIVLKALAYDADLDAMSVALKWTSSDSRVAKLAASSTANAVTTNTVTIPKNASGEATITVSATGANKKTISHKLIIQVQDKTPRLSTTSLTLNPNKEDGAVLRVITAYGVTIEPATFSLVNAENDKIPANDFQWEYDSAASSDTVHYYKIKPRYATIEEKAYKVKVSVDGKVNPTTLTITVKSSLPNPKVSIDKKQKKINLFYANDGTQIKPVIKSLGNAKVSRFELEPLNTDSKKYDRFFTENFEVDPETGIITQKSDNMILTDKKKPIVTGYLVLHFEGYKDKAVKKYKLTIPTQTVKPSYKLDRTSDTYNTRSGDRTIVLTLIDNKTKKPVVWDDEDWEVEKSVKSTVDAVERDSIELTGEGQIVMRAKGALYPGKVVLSFRNNIWAAGKKFEYTYTIKATGKDPTIKLKNATVSLNSNYTEQTEKFYLTSNQSDTVLAGAQDFVPDPVNNNEDQFNYIHVDYMDGEGTVSVDPGIRPGSYKFKCEHVEGSEGEFYNKVTLTVKVVNTLPTMTVKGSPALNLSAEWNNEYTETAELALNAKLPEGYEIDGVSTVETIECTTSGESEIREKFDWNIENNKLLIRLNSRVSQKKYDFTLKPIYVSSSGSTVEGKEVRFTVKVYSAAPSVKLSAKGTLNLVDRRGEYTLKNSIVYTPSFKNLKDTVEEARIFDADGGAVEPDDEESRYFKAEAYNGKIYVSPREGADVQNKKTYKVKMWVRFASYKGYEGMMVTDILQIKTAQILPKVTADRKDLNLYLSNKSYEAAFRVTPKAGSVGSIADVVFGAKDEKAKDSFEIRCGEPRADGSIDVYVKLKSTVSFASGSSNKLKMYVVFDGQGTNTTGPAVTMNIKIKK